MKIEDVRLQDKQKRFRFVNLSAIVNIIMAILYMVSGVFLLLGENIFDFSQFQKSGLGILLILYGLFRTISFLKKSREQNDDEE